MPRSCILKIKRLIFQITLSCRPVWKISISCLLLLRSLHAYSWSIYLRNNKEGVVKHIYFIAETKGSMSSMELREIEQCKIKCAKKFFSKITSEQVKYDVVDNYGKLMELVK